MAIVFKQVSYKHCVDGETLEVSYTKDFMNENETCKIERANLWDLTPEEKDMLLDSLVAFCQSPRWEN